MHPYMLHGSSSTYTPFGRSAQVRAKKMANWIQGHTDAGLNAQDLFEMMSTAITAVADDTNDHLNSSEKVFADII